MRGWLRQHAQALGASLRRLVKHAGLLSALVIGVVLALPVGAYALLESLNAVTDRSSLEPSLSVFLKPEAKRAEAEALGAALKSDPRVVSVRFLPREQALAELKTVEGLGEVIAALDRNPLPDAFVVQPRDTSPKALEALAVELRRLPQIGHVQADAAWAQRLAAVARIARLAVGLLAGLLGCALIAVAFNTIRLQILTQRDEIEVSKLLGATDAYIRRPFYYFGAVQGLAGAAVALTLVAAGIALLNREVALLADSYGSAFRLSHLALGDAAAVVAFAAALGWLGAHLSVSRHLREIEPN